MQTVTVAQMRDLEAEANTKGLPYAEMMRRAGTACGQKVLEMLNQIVYPPHRDVLFLIGPGNNGGDGLVAANHIKLTTPNTGVTIYLWHRQHTPVRDDDWPLHDAFELEQTILDFADDHDLRGFKYGGLLNSLIAAGLVVDALFGAGQHGPFPPDLEAILQALREEQAARPELKVVAVDIPTGIDTDTGEPLSENYVRADLTCTFAYAKPGLVQGVGAEAAGEIVVLDIGFGEVGVVARPTDAVNGGTDGV